MFFHAILSKFVIFITPVSVIWANSVEKQTGVSQFFSAKTCFAFEGCENTMLLEMLLPATRCDNSTPCSKRVLPPTQQVGTNCSKIYSFKSEEPPIQKWYPPLPAGTGK